MILNSRNAHTYLLTGLLSLFVLNSTSVNAQISAKKDKKMEWWREARFGMFIHWGVYSIWGGEYHGHLQRRSGAEWIMNRCKIGVSEYKVVASRFNPDKFNADSIVLLAKRTGMKYIVFTAKHHDGFAMFKSNVSNFNIVDYTPFKRDIIREMADACRRHNMKLGLYYSQSQDWCNAGGAVARKAMWEGWPNPDSTAIDNYTLKNNGHWDYLQSNKTFAQYIQDVSIPQIKEILTNYGDIASIWFDTPAEITKLQAQQIMDELKKFPNIIVNDRLKRPDFLGDYRTSEQKLPGEELEGASDVETCMTLNSSWGYKRADTNWKNPEKVVQTLISATSEGGNFLLNIGPKPDGLVPSGSIAVLNKVGEWMDINNEAVYGTTKAPLPSVTWGKTAIKNTPYNKEIFLYIFHKPQDGKLVIAQNLKVKNVQWLQGGEKLKFQIQKGQLVIDLGNSPMANNLVSVIKVLLNQKLSPPLSKKTTINTSKILD